MRRKDKEITDHKEIEEIIRKAEICFLAMSADNSPYVVPMNFGYKDNCIYFHCAQKGQKMDILKQNNRVSFSIALDVKIAERENSPCNWSTSYKSVIGFGNATIVNEPEKKKNALDIIMRQYSSKESFTYQPKAFESVSIIRIDITELTGKKSIQ